MRCNFETNLLKYIRNPRDYFWVTKNGCLVPDKINRYVFLYFLLILLLAPINLLSFDTFYYWDWSRHLALSYYDGSPMIAYMIKLSTLLFGDTLFALSIIGVVVTLLTSFIIYKTALLFLRKEASYVAMLLWLLSPIVTLDLLHQTTYDTPLTLFWALTVYYSIKYIKFNKTIDLYLIAANIGLILLSKYSGVVLLVSLVIFLMTTPYRHLLKSRHLYFALLVSTIIFSPVILWNYQHDWLSFLYQLNTHQLEETGYHPWNSVTSFFTIFLPSLNFLLVTPFLYWANKSKNKSFSSYFCIIVSITFILIYLFIAGKANIRGYWLQQYFITTSLLAAFCFQEFNYRKSTFLLIFVYALFSVVILLSSTTLISFPGSKNLNYYQAIQRFNVLYPQQNEAVVSTGWFEARMLYFLKGKPFIYTLNCGSAGNQYTLWSADFEKKVLNKTIKNALYMDIIDRSDCIKKYFDQCVPIVSPAILDKKGMPILFAYNCSNSDTPASKQSVEKSSLLK